VLRSSQLVAALPLKFRERLRFCVSLRGGGLVTCLVDVFDLETQNSHLAEHNPGCVEITCTDANAFRQWSQSDFQQAVATVEAAARRFEAGTLSRVAFGGIESATGLRRNPLGTLADVALCEVVRPVETLTYDWVHSMLQGGVLTTEVEALLELTGIQRVRLQRFLADASWVFPRSSRDRARHLHHIFDARRAAQDETKLKASCSELLGVYGLLRFFMELELAGKADAAAGLLSMAAVCRVIDLLLAAKRRQASIADVAGIAGLWPTRDV
jgi:hypothetical protein